MKAHQLPNGMIQITDETPNGTAIYHNADFRTYAPQLVTRENGQTVRMVLCEELIEGRWEAFYAVAR